MASVDRPNRLASWTRKGLVLAVCLLPIILIGRAITFWGHGIIDAEAMEFVLNYLQRRPFFAQIFDPQINDWGAYQARELSYVFDRIDARVFAFLLDRHVLVLVPMSGVVGLISFSALYFWGARKVLGLNAVIANMLLSLFLSCIVVQASTPIFYRSSKILLSVALLGFLFCTFALLGKFKRSLNSLECVGLFFLGLVMALCDRQAFYFLVSATLIVLMRWLIAKLRRVAIARPSLLVILVNTAAIATTIFYNRVLAPYLIHAVNGYWPNFAYQRLPRSALLDPALPGKAFYLFQQQISFFFGNIPFALLGSFFFAAALFLSWHHRRAITINNLNVLTTSVVSIGAVLGLFAVMIARHPNIYAIRDHSYWYYTLAVQVLLLFGATVWVSFFKSANRPLFNPILCAIIAALITNNVLAYARQREVMIQSAGWFRSQYEHSQLFVTQFATAPPKREKLQSNSSDLFWDDDANFLENVERSYLYLIGALQPSAKDNP